MQKKNDPVFLVHRFSESENELYHYGVPGMKWGVRRRTSRDKASWDAHKLAKKLAVAERDKMSTKDAASVGSRKTEKLYKKQLRSEKAYSKAYEKVQKKYRNTPYEQIISSKARVNNGRVLVSIALGVVGKEDGGSHLFNAVGGAGAKYKQLPNA